MDSLYTYEYENIICYGLKGKIVVFFRNSGNDIYLCKFYAEESDNKDKILREIINQYDKNYGDHTITETGSYEWKFNKTKRIYISNDANKITISIHP
jgi:hypothetical protein